MENEKNLTGYSLSRGWFDFAFENPDLLTPTHTAMYMWFIELNNRRGWVEKLSSPTSQTMAAIGLHSYNTYKKIFDDLVRFKFVKVISPSINQYTSVIITLSKFDRARYKALDKALITHTIKQSESTCKSINSINKQVNNKQINKETSIINLFPFEEFWKIYPVRVGKKKSELLWKKLSEIDKEKCLKDIPSYITDIPFENYKYLNPSNYLDERRWEDERQKSSANASSTVKHKFGESQKGAISHGE